MNRRAFCQLAVGLLASLPLVGHLFAPARTAALPPVPAPRRRRGPRYRVQFDRIVTPKFTKDADELRTYKVRGVTPEELNTQADDLVNRLLALPDYERTRGLAEMKLKNGVLHALVKHKIEIVCGLA